MSGINSFIVLLVSIALFAFCSTAEEPYFSRSPEEVSVNVGASVTLPCEVTPGNGIIYYWELNGSKVVNTTRRFMKGSNLHITRVDRERDTGEFTCIAEDITQNNAAITSSPASLLIEFIEEPEVVLQEPSKSEEIRKGGEVVLKCHLEASGDVHIEWFRNSRPISQHSRFELKKRRMVIKKVEPSDNGIYKCAARNAAGVRNSTKSFALRVVGENFPQIQVVPNDVIVKEGGAAYFECSYKSDKQPNWRFNGDEKPNERVVLHPNGSMRIDSVQKSDEGTYDCIGNKDVPEHSQIYTANLRVAFLEQFTSKSFEPMLPEDGDKAVAEGAYFQLTCLEPKALPYAKKWWENPAGHTISDRGEIYVDDGRLIINNVTLSDAGRYTCIAENMAGKTTKFVNIVVTTLPELLQGPSSITVDENDKSVLTCLYNTSYEKHTIVRWRKDGKLLKHDYNEPSSIHQRIRIFKHNGTLVIHSTQTADRGEYICEVITEGFEPVPSEPATISVIEQLRFVPPPVNKKLELDRAAKIHCKAQGTPPPLIHWEKGGLSSENFPAHITDMNGTLHFTKVAPEDKGKYTCIASNSQGTINVSITIDVVVAPRFIVPPKTPIEVNEGESLMIDCIAEGDPEPTVQWDKNSSMNDFDLTRFKLLPNGTLYISEVYKDDENKYGCTAGSSAGLNRKEIQLIVHGRDGYPTGADGDSTVTKAVLITMSVAGAYIVLVIGLMIWCRFRRRSRKLPIADENGEMEHQELKANENGTAPGSSKVTVNGIESHKEGQKSDGAETCNSQGSNQSKKSKTSYDKLALSRTLLKDLTLIGRGEFGDILVAKISQSHVSMLIADKRSSGTSNKTEKSDDKPQEDKEISCLVKVLSQTKEEASLAEFKREIDMFSKLSHDNITKLLGLCREEEPHYLIMEHTDWGDLKKFLVATKSGTPPPLTIPQCLAIIHQLARGMDHLASNRMVHKDLAARNCLVTSNLMVKIGMPKLSRDPYSQEYCKHVNQIIPLRWLPYEAVYEDEYSTKSDAYSFGVVIWEVFSQGELPQSKINDNTFLTKLKEKKLEWKAHESTPETLGKIQELCLDLNPQNRPVFSQLSKDISEILKSL
ncbi:tyrosine-protein kinase-like otk isoform X2 [Rhynchophorus ferrugineus]|uniref:tyrosine-protein kinase-like otk isoform X2 n=1 Tax=Rhynchophorus ferrugineus TaxID=354439 RepID=UPI003FCD6633